MTLLPGLLFAAVAVWVLGGDLGRATALRFQRTVLLYAAFAGQLFAFGPVRLLSERQVHLAQLATYALLIAFCVVNRRLPGLWVVALGVGCNALVIAANGGVMPVEPSAILGSGWTLDDYASAYPNVAADHGASLWFLGDVFAMPRFPGSAVLSVGDLLIVAGAWVLLQRAASHAGPASVAGSRASRALLAVGLAGLLVTTLVVIDARYALVAPAAAVLGASLAPIVLATSRRPPPAARCLTACALLGAGALVLAGWTTSGATSALALGVCGLVAALAALTLVARQATRAPARLSS
jgi:hypothetical protein